MLDGLDEVVKDFLDDYYKDSGVDWRVALDGEAIALDTVVDGDEAEVESLTFKVDGVRQVAPPQPFDAIASAEVLQDARQKGK